MTVHVDVVKAAQRGDHAAFEAIVVATAERLFAIARLLLGDPDRAEDAVQDALAQAWRYLPRLRDPSRFDGWLYRLLVNACNDLSRSHRRYAAEVRVIRNEPVAPDDVARVADREQLERGFRHLKLEHRVPVVLHYYVGLNVPEIAASLGIPEGTAKSRLHYATEALRAALEADARGRGTATAGRPA